MMLCALIPAAWAAGAPAKRKCVGILSLPNCGVGGYTLCADFFKGLQNGSVDT